jgi:hypothetical protein
LLAAIDQSIDRSINHHTPYHHNQQGKTVNVNGEDKKGKLRNFVETIDLQVCLAWYGGCDVVYGCACRLIDGWGVCAWGRFD